MELHTRPQRAIDDLLELRRRTSTAAGAQRVAWTETWDSARRLLRERLAELPVDVSVDEAGNLWALLPGDSPDVVIVGSHLDSVPDGGWLDGAYGVMGGLEVLRAAAEQASRPYSLALVDWADEEGARFGRSLFGSAAAAGTLDLDSVRDLTDADGQRLVDVLESYGISLDKMSAARARLARAVAYLELHIEQGPVLEHEGLPIGVVQGTVGIERYVVTFEGVAAHAGSTPIDRRHDAMIPAARTVLAVRETAERNSGVGTVGSVVGEPGIVTATAERATLLVDLRHIDAERLAAMLADAREAAEKAAAAEGCRLRWDRLLSLAPQPFDPRLVERVADACTSVCGAAFELPSGALHDATSIAPHVPTAMLFAASIDGLSHNRSEDSRYEDLRDGVAAFGRLVGSVLTSRPRPDQGS
ncbi:hydantoinase/carbamoylase family amidase [Microtetraspora malaysiensis]|uniref:hydantoinase/carbamoylase family amidase n=1 Tax=Microtetraspora malaysiensis TaxID=161358 RepID=UPI003D91EEE9